MGVASGCGEQEVGVASGNGWNLWVWLVGVVVRRYIDFIIGTYPYSSCICSFLQQHPYILFVFLCFSFFFQYFLVIILCNIFNIFFAQYKHTYGQLRASHGSHMKAAQNVLCMNPAMDISCVTSTGVV